MIYKLKVNSDKELVKFFLESIGEVFYEEDFFIFGTLESRQFITDNLATKGLKDYLLEDHEKFLSDAMLSGKLSLREATAFADLPDDTKKDLKELQSVVSWLTAFLIGAGVQTYKLRKIQKSLDKFVADAGKTKYPSLSNKSWFT